jgi:predicted transcriptional regulator
MAILKFWLDVFGEMVGVEGVLIAFQSLSTIKKGTSPLNFQSNESFAKFLTPSIRSALV